MTGRPGPCRSGQAPQSWQVLLSPPGREMVQALDRLPDPRSAAVIARWRGKFDAPVVAAAVDLVLARRRARGKLTLAERLLLEPSGLEQASPTLVAAHKARRLAEAAGGGPVWDLCCGVGADAMALAAHRPVFMVDQRPLRVWMARHNVTVTGGRPAGAVAADVTGQRWRGLIFHLDPSRRHGQERVRRFADYRPGPDFIETLRRHCPAGAVKLSPAIDLAELDGGEVEFVSWPGGLNQAVWWLGQLAGCPRRATVIGPDGRCWSLAGRPDDRPLPVEPVRRYVMAIDPAVERAQLLGRLVEQAGAAMVHPRLGLLTADRPVEHPMLRGFEVLEEMAWRQEMVRRWLAARGAGPVVVKTRGRAVDATEAARRLSGRGDEPFVVFVLRWDRKVRAMICRAVGQWPGAGGGPVGG